MIWKDSAIVSNTTPKCDQTRAWAARDRLTFSQAKTA